MKKYFLIAALLFVVGLVFAEVKLVQQQGNDLIIDFSAGDYTIHSVNGYSKIEVEDANFPVVEGSPSLPSFEFKIGVPAGGGISYSILSQSQKTVDLAQRIIPVPFISTGENGVSDYDYRIQEDLYNANPSDLLTVLPMDRFRGHTFVPIVLNPFSYDGQRKLSLTGSMRIRIQILGDTKVKNISTQDEYSQIILNQLVNKDQAKSWIEHTRDQVNFADFSSAAWWMRVETDRYGMFRVNPSQLTGVNLPDIDPRSFRLFTTGGDVLPFQAVSSGAAFQEVPILVTGEADGSFDSADYIVFYGADRSGYSRNTNLQNPILYHNPYSNNTVFWLTFAGDFAGSPLRMASMANQGADNDTATHTEVVHVEEENYRREITGFDWYMTRMFGSSTLDYSFDIELPDLNAALEHNLQLRIRQENVSSSLTHSVSVYVNGTIIPSGQSNPDNHSWLGTSAFVFSRSSDAFVPGTNRITIRVHRNNTIANLYLDYYKVSYTKNLQKGNSQFGVNPVNTFSNLSLQYNFTGSATGIMVYQADDLYHVQSLEISPTASGFSFVTDAISPSKMFVARATELYTPVLMQVVDPPDLSSSTAAVQSIIVTPPEFIAQAQDLAAKYQQNWGYHTMVVLQDDVFNQFNGGHPDPAAIRQFVRYVYHNFPAPKIQSLTLLGLGTLDWRNYSGLAGVKNKIIVYQHPTSNTASDDYFTMITTNSYPEIAVGRYPVKDARDMNNMLENFTRYTQAPTPGLWRNSMILLADDNFNGDTTVDWQHTIDMQQLSTTINPSAMVHKVFAADYEFDEFQNKPKVRDELFRQINDGRLIWYYVGHGSFDALGAQNYFTGATDMGRFQNADKLPLFIAASCEVSTFDYWAYESLGQKTVLQNNKGAIASVASSRKSFPDPNHLLMSYFLRNMINFRNPVGFSLIDAKLRHTQSSTNDETYLLFGDPNLRINPPARDSSMVINVEGLPQNSSVNSRQLVSVQGAFSEESITGEATLLAWDADREFSINNIPLTMRGTQIFRGAVSVDDSALHGSFYIPDDIASGESGMILAYIWDANQKADYVSYYYPLVLSDEVLAGYNPENPGPPEISIYLGSMDFREGDTVSTSPMLYAKIEDSNGINVTGSAGHNILLVVDNSLQPISATEYFSYDRDSHVSGMLAYPLSDLSEGYHTIQVIAFDNFNLPSVANTSFIAKNSGAVSLENLLPYPNPMKDDGYITFIISDAARITLDIFTLSGKRIRRIETDASAGFNKIAFDGRDSFGDALANNTYFIRVKATTADGKSVEKREKLVIYK